MQNGEGFLISESFFKNAFRNWKTGFGWMIGWGEFLWDLRFFVDCKQFFHKICLFDLWDRDSFEHVGLHTFENELIELWRDFGFDLRFNEDIHFELIFGFALVKRGLTVQKLINHDSKGPYVGFGSIVVVNEPFWTHIDGTTDRNVGKEGFCANCKSKVCDFVGVIIEENVGNFKVSVDDKILV